MDLNSHSLIRTKLQKPRITSVLVERRHLVEKLNGGVERKLTLVSAPTGYGKSTLISAWLEQRQTPSIWLSLDKNDNDLRNFLGYFINAIRTVYSNCCAETQAILNGPQLPPHAYLAATLINESALLPERTIIILDDYQHIHDHDIQELLNSLIHQHSDMLHLVIITRQDPLMGIPTLRARGELSEIRINDLRFNRDEVQRYWQATVGQTLLRKHLDSLTERTEGWIAGLHLASLAVRGRDSDADILEMISGSHQYVMDYLTDEVLSRQSESVQEFLLKTAILDRFCASQCDALLDTSEIRKHAAENISSQGILDYLVESNLFVIPLDYQGKWFRYHHLFQELLLHKLRMKVDDEKLASLHHAAAAWWAQNGFVDDALDHYLSANELSEAVDLVAAHRYALMNGVQWQQLAHHLNRFPPAVVEQSPELLMLRTWLLYHQAKYAALPAVLNHLEVTIAQASLTLEKESGLRGEISALRSLLHYFAVEPEKAIASARLSLEKSPPELWIVRILARMTLAGALQMMGDLSGALAVIYSGFEREKNQNDAFGATLLVTACNIYWIAADLAGLVRAAEQIMVLTQNAKLSQMRGWACYNLGAAAYEVNDLSAAEELFSVVVRQPYLNYGDAYAYSACGLALTYQAQGRPQEARDMVESMIAFTFQTGNTSLLPVVQAFQAELGLRQGHMPTARRWVSSLAAPPDIVPLFRLYAPHFTLLRVWLAQGTSRALREATDYLSQLETFFERAHNTRFLIEVLSFQALLDGSQGRAEPAMAALRKAIELAQPGGFIRLFVDLGPQMARLLTELSFEDAETTQYVAEILVVAAAISHTVGHKQYAVNPQKSLLEPLTDREIDVIVLLAQRRTDKEIAAQLIISLNTVRTHCKNIYSKLGVNSRRQAVVRAKELGMLLST